MKKNFREWSVAFGLGGLLCFPLRAGASTLAEAAAFALPTAIVPYPHASGHQRLNAEAFADAGAAILIRELALPIGWVDVKVCAVDAVWSGLKLVIRKELRLVGKTVLS